MACWSLYYSTIAVTAHSYSVYYTSVSYSVFKLNAYVIPMDSGTLIHFPNIILSGLVRLVLLIIIINNRYYVA